MKQWVLTSCSQRSEASGDETSLLAWAIANCTKTYDYITRTNI